MRGYFCDRCETHLDDSDFASPESKSYTCYTCGFAYVHGAETAQEQVDKFNDVKGDTKMTSLWVKIEIGAGHIKTVIEEAKQLAAKLICGVMFEFNGIPMDINADSNAEEKYNEYLANLER